ncbi:carboxypeptidase-like regulatory domain-containing protein [Bremerella sp. T1]|uniref:carboxypeptidase-like regulatory domain-containing protein n=1 Tax=Bremerella sp. TYQ1 TaxID=3119568 RepID=UPI001CC90A23|nr:carboxypeptidase-like regulatory domain-containing protein [Bremerella volcania]UBM34757.1 carboxypeptidase-like regulatory domain-containing protein [Bremerella volcania]
MRFAYRDGMLLFTLCTLAVGLAGCGSAGDPEVVRVSGTVTMDGQPLPNATVLFVSGTGRPSGAMTDEQGHYELNYTGDQKGARIGPNRVQITTAQGPTETMDGKPIPAVRETVPARYNARTELEFTVTEKGSNVADFELSSK